LIGGIPTGFILVKMKEKTDIRHYGSGNIGFTNVLRISGITPGSIVLIIDVSKAFITAYFLPLSLSNIDFSRFLIGLAVIGGNIFSPFLGFKGGKGVATGLGVAIAISPYSVAGALIVFGSILFTTRYVSLSSLSAAFSFFLITLILFISHSLTVFAFIFSVLLFISVVLTHISNIKLLIQ